MREEEIYSLFSKLLDVDIEVLKINNVLAQYQTWDSLSLIRVLPQLDLITGKKLNINQIANAKTIADIVNL